MSSKRITRGFFSLRFAGFALIAAAIFVAVFAGAAWAMEVEYGGTFCGHSKQTMLQSSPELKVFVSEAWAIEVPSSGADPWQKFSTHCLSINLAEKGKRTSKGSCLWTSPEGDTFIGEYENVPGQPGTWTFLSGTGKFAGVRGQGTFKILYGTKPFADQTGAFCAAHQGKYTLP